MVTREPARLRHEAEAGPVSGLGWVALRALELTDELCRDSRRRGDALAFARQVRPRGPNCEGPPLSQLAGA